MSHERVAIGVDDTDHVAFFCPQCRGIMHVRRVTTVGVLRGVPTQDACTHVYLKCTKCEQEDWRKFSWLTEDGKYCTHRTDCDLTQGRKDTLAAAIQIAVNKLKVPEAYEGKTKWEYIKAGMRLAVAAVNDALKSIGQPKGGQS